MQCILKSSISVCFIAGFVLLFASCRRSNNNDDKWGYASDASRIELINNDVISMADAAGTYYNSDYIAGCSTVSTDTISVPHVLIIRFGNTDCVGLDGKKRSGSIYITYNGEYSDSSQLHTITFDSYAINDEQLTGSVQVIRIDTTVTGNWYYRVKVAEALNTNQNSAGSQVITWNGSLVRRWISGFETGDRSDDVFAISGNTTLVRGDGSSFNFGISTPLQFALDCSYAESGVVNITTGTTTSILDYGSGTCDPNAQVTIGQSVYPILLTP